MLKFSYSQTLLPLWCSQLHAQQVAAREIYWKGIAARVDQISRAIFPILFTTNLLYTVVASGTHRKIGEYLF